ncbi:MAG: hypothetical protein ACM3VS_06305 [Candidatus Dadabacteria bacterium]
MLGAFAAILGRFSHCK